MGTPPDTVFYSSANYQPIPLEQLAIAQNLSQGVCQPLEFPRLIDRAYQDGVRIFLELGSGGSCSRWITETLQTQDHLAMCVNRRGADDLATIVKMLAQLVSHKVDLDLSPLYLPQETPTQITTLKETVPTSVASLPCLFNEDDILEFIEGKVSKVFGENYQEIDSYTRRVRMPSPPFLFVSRVTQLEGKLGNYKSGFIETEYDIPQMLGIQLMVN